jgi:hypothetical protein
MLAKEIFINFKAILTIKIFNRICKWSTDVSTFNFIEIKFVKKFIIKMSEAREFHSARIRDVQWNAFYAFVNENYKEANSIHLSADSESQRMFSRILFKDGNSDIQRYYQTVNDFWITMMRDSLANNINLGNNDNQLAELNEQTVEYRKTFLQGVINRGLAEFRSNQKPGQVG